MKLYDEDDMSSLLYCEILTVLGLNIRKPHVWHRHDIGTVRIYS